MIMVCLCHLIYLYIINTASASNWSSLAEIISSSVMISETVVRTGGGWESRDDRGAVSQVVWVLSVHIFHAQPGPSLTQLVWPASSEVTLTSEVKCLVLVVTSPDKLSYISETNGSSGYSGGHTGHLVVRTGGGGAGWSVWRSARVLHSGQCVGGHWRQTWVAGL